VTFPDASVLHMVPIPAMAWMQLHVGMGRQFAGMGEQE
jgi:hypothetical protein